MKEGYMHCDLLLENSDALPDERVKKSLRETAEYSNLIATNKLNPSFRGYLTKSSEDLLNALT